MLILSYILFACLVSIKWFQDWCLYRLSNKLWSLHVCLLIALAVLFTWSWYHWMSSFNSLIPDFSFFSKVLCPLVARAHESIHKFQVFFLIYFIEFVNEYWFHNALIEFFPVVFDGSFLLTLRCCWVGSNSRWYIKNAS